MGDGVDPQRGVAMVGSGTGWMKRFTLQLDDMLAAGCAALHCRETADCRPGRCHELSEPGPLRKRQQSRAGGSSVLAS